MKKCVRRVNVVTEEAATSSQREYDALDPVVKSLVESTIDLEALTAEMMKAVSLGGFDNCSVNEMFTSFYFVNHSIKLYILVNLNEPFTMSWETKIPGWYVDKGGVKIPPPGSYIDSVGFTLYVPCEIFGIEPRGNPLGFITADCFIMGRSPSNNVIVHKVAGDAVEVDKKNVDLEKVKKDIDTMSAEIFDKTIDGVMAIVNEWEERNEAESDSYEVIDG